MTGVLGEGGYGVIYRGFDSQLRRDVAIKVPHRGRIKSADDAETFLNEARTLAGLDHPGIVPVYDVGQTDDGLCYIVSKYVAGGDLAHLIAEGLPPHDVAANLIVQAAEALHHAHQRGLVHRDIKHANILIDEAGHPLVADFGLALSDEGYGRGSADCGTPAYMSPEQARGEGHRVDARSDIYSLGVVFYELLTGRRPYRSTGIPQLYDEITTGETRPPRQLDDTVPHELDRICLKALAKRVADRYSTALEMADDLRRWETRHSYWKRTVRSRVAQRADSHNHDSRGPQPDSAPAVSALQSSVVAVTQRTRSATGWVIGLVALVLFVAFAFVELGKGDKSHC